MVKKWQSKVPDPRPVLAFVLSVLFAAILATMAVEWRLVKINQSDEVAQIDERVETPRDVATEDAETDTENTPEKISSSSPGVFSRVTNWVSQDPVSSLTESLSSTISSLSDLFPGAEGGNTIYYDGDEWRVADDLYFGTGNISIGRSGSERLEVGGNAVVDGTLKVTGPNNSNLIQLYPNGNTGYLSSNGGALFIENTENDGSGIGIYSNAGASAEGNMINIKVDNPNFNQAAFYMNYDGTSNAVEIRANTNDRSSNALSLTNFNTLDSGLGVIGYEIDRGSIKVTHHGDGSDSSASGLSIDLKGTGTAAQGIYVDSTATGGTTGKLLRLRNETTDRFVVDYRGSVTIGSSGTDTSLTKIGNTSGDEFFIGTNGAFRVQRSATDSEAFRTQVAGDTYGRWLGTADGKLKWSSGSADYDVILERTGANVFQLSGATFDSKSFSTNSDVMRWIASDGSRLGRIVETGGGHGWFEIDDSAGSAKIVFRADGGSSYVNSGNFGIGTTSFGGSASKVLALGNATAPTTSIADGVQLYAEDFDDGDGTATSELRVRDEDGNVTTLSPHNFSATPDKNESGLDWSYYSQKEGRVVNVNMAELVREVEILSGRQFLYIADAETGQQLRVLGEAETVDTSQVSNTRPANALSGTVVIPQGSLRAEVAFATAVTDLPVVSVTPLDFVEGPYKVEKRFDGFTLVVRDVQTTAVSFDWVVVE